MLVYKNEKNESINVAGYQFYEPGQELLSNINIKRFEEAVGNNLLSATENGIPPIVEIDSSQNELEPPAEPPEPPEEPEEPEES